jgi:bacteriocin-like protein
MTTPDPTPDTELEVEELTDENLEEVSGGERRALGSAAPYFLTNGGSQGRDVTFVIGNGAGGAG